MSAPYSKSFKQKSLTVKTFNIEHSSAVRLSFYWLWGVLQYSPYQRPFTLRPLIAQGLPLSLMYFSYRLNNSFFSLRQAKHINILSRTID